MVVSLALENLSSLSFLEILIVILHMIRGCSVLGVTMVQDVDRWRVETGFQVGRRRISDRMVGNDSDGGNHSNR